jgi:hypothetical protein
MKFRSGWQADGRRHEYCTDCHVEAVERITEDNETYFDCAHAISATSDVSC